MLAGRMKLRHFLMIAGGAGVLLCAGFFALPMMGVSLLGERGDATPSDLPSAVEAPAPPPAASVAPATSTPAAAATGGPPTGDLRDVDRVVLDWQGKALGSDKLKDVTSGRPFKVNLYQDAGHAVMNRAKIDLDRDDKWDEKWTFDAAGITRQVAPGDDEDYTEDYEWSGSGWARR